MTAAKKNKELESKKPRGFVGREAGGCDGWVGRLVHFNLFFLCSHPATVRVL